MKADQSSKRAKRRSVAFANSPAIVIGAALASLLVASANADPARTLRGSVEGGEEGEPVWVGVFGDGAEAKREANRIEANLPSAHFIAGRVVDSDGAPVAGVDVVANVDGWRTATTKSGKDGAYRLGPLPHGERVSLFARSPGRGSTMHHGGIIVPREGLVLVLRRYAIAGRLVDETTGMPVREFRLTLNDQHQKARWEHGFQADNGRFRVPLDEVPMQGAVHSLVVQAQGYPPWFMHLTPADGAGIDLGEIVLVPGRSLSGRVVDIRTGNPIPGARINRADVRGEYRGWRHWMDNTSLRAVADENGMFVLEAVPPETGPVSASAEGYGTKFIDLPHGVPHLRFELEAVAPAPMVVITGSIVLADCTPVRGRAVALFHADDAAAAGVGYHSESIGYAMMLENGGFRLARRGLPDGAYVLVASSPAGVVARRTVVVSAGQSVEDVRLVVQEGNWLRISMAGLLAAERARVTIRDEKGRAVFSSRFGNGSHRVSGVPDEAEVVANASVRGQSRWLRTADPSWRWRGGGHALRLHGAFAADRHNRGRRTAPWRRAVSRAAGEPHRTEGALPHEPPRPLRRLWPRRRVALAAHRRRPLVRGACGARHAVRHRVACGVAVRGGSFGAYGAAGVASRGVVATQRRLFQLGRHRA